MSVLSVKDVAPVKEKEDLPTKPEQVVAQYEAKLKFNLNLRG